MEVEHRAILAAREAAVGASHPDVFESCYNLALCLESQDKLPEALTFSQQAQTGRNAALGSDHPSSKLAKQLCDRIEKRIKEK